MLLKTKLLQIAEGLYTVYIFEDVNRSYRDEYKYITCTKPPNWIYHEQLEVGDIGFLHIKYVESGVDTWYDSKLDKSNKYKYTGCYFLNFFKEKQTTNINKEYKF